MFVCHCAEPKTHHLKNYTVTETSTEETTTQPFLGEEGPKTAGIMTSEGESRKKASGPTTLLNTKTILMICAWNVRTMSEAGKAAQVAAEMRNDKIGVLGLSEMRWLKVGQFRFQTGEIVLYSGHEEEGAAHAEGVGFMLSKHANRSLIGWEAHRARLIKASFSTKKKGINTNIVLGYAPTNEKEEEEKDNFDL